MMMAKSDKQPRKSWNQPDGALSSPKDAPYPPSPVPAAKTGAGKPQAAAAALNINERYFLR